MAFDLTGMMGKVKELQDKMQQAQQEIQHITATGEAGGGLVRATAMCISTTNAADERPLSWSRNLLIASTPPADAPMPTTTLGLLLVSDGITTGPGWTRRRRG